MVTVVKLRVFKFLSLLSSTILFASPTLGMGGDDDFLRESDASKTPISSLSSRAPSSPLLDKIKEEATSLRKKVPAYAHSLIDLMCVMSEKECDDLAFYN